jgi:FdhE protein
MRTSTDMWDRRIRRADRLASIESPAAQLVTFYARVLRCQRDVYRSLDGESLTGDIARDMAVLAARRSMILQEVAEHGPAPLASAAHALIDDNAAATEALARYWRDRSDSEFFAKTMMQAYGRWLEGRGVALAHDASGAANRCPRCGGAPQVSILEAGAPDAGGSRLLQCATCLATWPFARVVCPSCGEQDEKQLGYFHAPEFDHVRVDACQRCRRYIKTIDLGRLGFADPLVDEVAAAPLDAWAREHDYEKIELNLVGL